MKALKIFHFKHRESSFISHMVQMKDCKIHTHLKKKQTLYPTWFRWKNAWGTTKLDYAETFISHMVQMKESS